MRVYSTLLVLVNARLKLDTQSAYIRERLGGRLRPNNALTAAKLAGKPIPVDGFLQFDATIVYS